MQSKRPDSAELRSLYSDDGRSAREIAQDFAVSKTTVLRWLRDAGIETRLLGGQRSRVSDPTGYRPDAAELRRLYWQEGLSQVAIASRFGVRPETVGQWMRSGSIPARQWCRGWKDPDLAIHPLRLKEFYWDKRMSFRQIAALTKISSDVLRRCARDAGIPIRTRQRAAAVMMQSGRHRSSWKRGVRPRGSAAPDSKWLMQWVSENPEKAAEARERGRRRASASRWGEARGRWVHCEWCGLLVYRIPSQLRSSPHSYCCASHSRRAALHRRRDPDAPRPLLLDALRERAGGTLDLGRANAAASEVGAGDSEVQALLSANRVAADFLARALGQPKRPSRPANESVEKRDRDDSRRPRKSIENTAVGSVGAALLAAERKRQHGAREG